MILIFENHPLFSSGARLRKSLWIWSRIENVEVDLVNKNAAVDAQTGARPIIKVVTTMTHVFDNNIQKKLLLEYDRKYKIKSEE